MYWYRVYGERLASDVPLPEARPTEPGEPAWTFRQLPPAPVAGGDQLLGTQDLYPGCQARLYRTGRGHRIVVDDTGVYDLTAGGRDITWQPTPDSTSDFGRAHLLGRVLATSLHHQGSLVLHGSAVAYDAGAVIFLAPKHTGKSTLALALTLAGARLISDDSLAVDAGPVPSVAPGVQSMRLLQDAAAALAGALPVAEQSDGKVLLASLPPERLESGRVPIQAIYLLVAAESISGDRAVDRQPLPPPLAAAGIVGQGKVAEMLGPAEAPELLRRAARLASAVPVYRMPVLRDLHRLPEVVTRVAGWHGQASETLSA
ncbi:MAG TPA: hypothetical protein VG692_11700 [Gemmatimonadales bacterium]|nr:hypothetical protein [Gemmatimonadales bacterium]